MAAAGSRRKRNVKAGMLLTGGNITNAACSFLRNIIIARLISVEDFGIAATFALTVALIEMASNLATDRLLVQAQDGNEPRLQSTAHTIQLFQGIIGAVVLYLIAEPIALLFDIPDVVWAFEVLAVVPLIRGVAHLDRARMQRDMNFKPLVSVEAGSQLLATVLSIPFGYYIGDYRAMLWVLIAQMSLFTLISFIVAERRYTLAWDTGQIKRFCIFGWPLLANGFLMFGVMQGDRTIVGASFSMAELGWFSAAFAMTLAPAMVMAKGLQSFFLPQLSSRQGNDESFLFLAQVCMQICLIGSIVIAIGFAVAGPALLLLLFGEKYVEGIAVVSLLGLIQSLRAAKAGPTIVAISKAETRNPLDANLVRSISLGASLLAVIYGYGIIGVVLGALFGEVLSLFTSAILLRKRVGVPVTRFLVQTTAMVLAAVLLAGLCETLHTFYHPVLIVTLGVVAALAFTFAFGVFMGETRNWLLSGNDNKS